MILELFVFFVAVVVIGSGLIAGYRRMSRADAGVFQPLAGGGPLPRAIPQDLESQPTSYGIQTSPFEVIYDNGRRESLSSAPSSPTSAVGSSPPTNNEHYALESPSARFLKFKFPLQSEATILDFENADVKNLFSQITASTTTTEDEVPRSPIPHRDSAKSLFSEDLDDDDYHDSPYATRCIDKYDLALTAAKPMLKVN